MTTTIQNRQVSEDDEFNDPNWNYAILMTELKDRIVDLQYDLNNIRDPEVLGLAHSIYIKLKKDYFDLMVQSMNLEHDIRIERSLENMIGGNSNE